MGLPEGPANPSLDAAEPFPFFQALLIPQLLAILLITQRAPRLLRLAFNAVYTTYGVHVCFSGRYTMGNVLADYSLGLAVTMQYLTFWAHLWCLEDSNGRKHVLDAVRHEDDTFEKIRPAERGLIGRVLWAYALLQSSRSVGWSCQVKGVPDTPEQSKSKFIATSLLRCLKYYVILDAGIWYTHQPGFTFGPNATSITAFPFLKRCITVWFQGACGYATINMQYLLLGVVCVALGVSEPKRWPKLFGRVRDAYTVRRFWGNSWHQMLRRFIGPLTTSLMSFLSIPHGTRLSSNATLLIAFGISSFLHLSGDVAAHIPWKQATAIFFPVQPLAIMAEDLVIEWFNGGRNKPNRLTGKNLVVVKLLGGIWVFMWFVLTIPLFVDAQMKGRDRKSVV